MTHTDPEPLTPADIAEFAASGWLELLIDHEGKTYSTETIWSCVECDDYIFKAAERGENWNGESLCQHCWGEAYIKSCRDGEDW
jgi:hypothetical protein